MEADVSSGMVLRGSLLEPNRVARETKLFPAIAMLAALLDPRVRADLGDPATEAYEAYAAGRREEGNAADGPFSAVR
jgi:hypothetical protein